MSVAGIALEALRAEPQVSPRSHPDLAANRGIAAGDWVRISTPVGSVRARPAE